MLPVYRASGADASEPELFGVLDVDSDKIAAFDDTDAVGATPGCFNVTFD